MGWGEALAGIVGALQGTLQGIQTREANDTAAADRKKQLELKALNLLAEQGDDEVRRLAVAGLMEAASKPKFKGGVLSKLFSVGDTEDNPYLKQIDGILARHGRPGEIGSNVAGPPAEPEPAAPQATSQTPVMAGPQALAQPTPTAGPESAWAPGDIGKDAGDLLPQHGAAGGPPPVMSAGMAPRAGVPTNGQPSGINSAVMARGAAPAPGARPAMPDQINQAISAMGPPPNPTPPSRDEIAADMAKQYGSTPAVMNSDAYTHPGHLVDKGNEQNVRDLRTGVETNYRAGVVDTRTRVDKYREDVASLIKTGTVAQTQEAGMTARERLRQAGETERAGIGERTRTASEKKAATLAWQKENADLDKMEAKVDPLTKKPLYTSDAIAGLRAQADSRFAEITGEPPKRAGDRAAVRAAASTTASGGPPAATVSRSGPPAAGAGTMLPAGEGVRLAAPPGPPTPQPAPGPAPGGPPAAPVTAADRARVETLKTKVQTRGRQSLTPDEYQFLLDYYNKLKAAGAP